METMGSYLSPRPEGRASENLESRFTESPTAPGQQHLQGPDGPSLVLTPGPAAAQLQRHLLSGLPPASHPQPGQREGPNAPATTEECLPFLLPAGQKRLRIPPGGAGWQPVAEGSSHTKIPGVSSYRVNKVILLYLIEEITHKILDLPPHGLWDIIFHTRD